MKRDILTIILLLTLTSTATAQVNKKFIDSGSINYQFDHLINKSNRYEDYKVVKINWLHSIKKNVGDSLNQSQIIIRQNEEQMAAYKGTIDSLHTIISSSNSNINNLKTQIETISVFGVQIKKPLFKTIVFSLLGVLLFLLIIFIGKFKRSNRVTIETKKSIQELDEEFDAHRKRALEREQKVMRKLQDELNKQKQDS